MKAKPFDLGVWIVVGVLALFGVFAMRDAADRVSRLEQRVEALENLTTLK